MVDSVSFSSWLEGIMVERGMSQADVARRCGVTRSAINGVVTRGKLPGRDLCMALSRGLSLAPEVVFRQAGLLPEKARSALAENLAHRISMLDEGDQAVVDSLVTTLIDKRRNKSTYETKSGGQAS